MKAVKVLLLHVGCVRHVACSVQAIEACCALNSEALASRVGLVDRLLTMASAASATPPAPHAALCFYGKSQEVEHVFASDEYRAKVGMSCHHGTRSLHGGAQRALLTAAMWLYHMRYSAFITMPCCRQPMLCR